MKALLGFGAPLFSLVRGHGQAILPLGHVLPYASMALASYAECRTHSSLRISTHGIRPRTVSCCRVSICCIMADRQTPTLQEQHVRLSALVDSSEFCFNTNAVLSRYLSNTVQCALQVCCSACQKATAQARPSPHGKHARSCTPAHRSHYSCAAAEAPGNACLTPLRA